MTTETRGSVNAPKFGRGQNPRSLANLRPAWKPGESGHAAGQTGPVVTPALRRYASWPLEQLESLDIEKLPTGEAIAVTWLLDAITTGSFSTGAKSREGITQRLDGDDKKGDTYNIEKAVLVRYVTGELPK